MESVDAIVAAFFVVSYNINDNNNNNNNNANKMIIVMKVEQ